MYEFKKHNLQHTAAAVWCNYFLIILISSSCRADVVSGHPPAWNKTHNFSKKSKAPELRQVPTSLPRLKHQSSVAPKSRPQAGQPVRSMGGINCTDSELLRFNKLKLKPGLKLLVLCSQVQKEKKLQIKFTEIRCRQLCKLHILDQQS